MKKVFTSDGRSVPCIITYSILLLAFLWIASPAYAQVVVHRINAGGPATAAGDSSFPDWGEDQQAANNPAPVQFAKKGTPSPFVNAAAAGDQTAGKNKASNLGNLNDPGIAADLFKTQRWDPASPAQNMIWSFPVSDADYKVRLYFNELFGEGIGSRVFDIYIDGVLVDDDLDILQLTGNQEKVGVVREYDVSAADATMDIAFVSQSDLPPMLSAIELVYTSSRNLPPVITAIEDQTNFEGDNVELQVLASDPDDQIVGPQSAQSIASYTAENLPPGLSIDQKSGLISGTIEVGAAGVYNVRVIVLDNGVPPAGATETFLWTVSDGSPVLDNPIADIVVPLGAPPIEIDLSTVFSDPGGFELTFTVEGNTTPSVVSTGIVGSILTLTVSDVNAGNSDITVRATNTLDNNVEDQFNVKVEGGIGMAVVQITPDGGLGQSTWNPGVLNVQNFSANGVQIEQVTINIAGSIFPDMVWDPAGTAGDSGGKCLTADSGALETGFVAPGKPCVDPFSLPNEGGYFAMTLNFNDFDPNEVFTFSVDADPTSIQGNPGVGDAGAVSGIELMGGEVTVKFSNGTTLVNNLSRLPLSKPGSQAVVAADPPAAPAILLNGFPGESAVTVTNPNQSILAEGPPGAKVRLIQLDGRLNLQGVPNGGFDIEPYEANEAIGNVWEYTATIEGDGNVTIPVTLHMSQYKDGSGGLNYFIATIDDAFAGNTSNIVIMELESETMVNFNSGWNLIGLSYIVDDNNYANLYSAVSPKQAPYYWGGAGYLQEANVAIGKGYWQEVGSAGDVTIVGSSVPSVSLNLATGWNMISGPSCIFDMANLQDPGAIMVPNTLFRYEGAYVLSNTLTPNTGYWIQVSQAGTLTFDCTHVNVLLESASKGAAAERELDPHAGFGILRIEDENATSTNLYFGGELELETLKNHYGMPPIAPGGFDVRFADQSRLLEGDNGLIRVQSEAFPVRIELVARPEGSLQDYVIEALIGDKAVASYSLSEGHSIQIDNEKITGLRLGTGKMEIDALPEAFTLSGNYPNPFNPTTNLVFDLPEDATLQVGIYDLLGRRVMTIDAVEMAAGSARQLQIDASSLASGLYVYRIQAAMASGAVTRSGRMTLLK